MGSIYSNLSIYIKSALVFYGKEIIQSLPIDLKIYHNSSKSLADYITLIMSRIIINNLRKFKPYLNSKANLEQVNNRPSNQGINQLDKQKEN